MKKNKSVIWIAIFLLIVVSPVLTYSFLGQYVDTENYENRKMASKPIFTVENYELFPDEFETYYNDHIPFRNQLIRFNNFIDFFVFKQSSSERVAIGKDGWLFYCNSSDGNPIEQSLGYWNFTNDQLQTIADSLVSTKRVLDSMDIEFVLFIAPNKETIYMDKIPGYYKLKNQYTSTDRLVDYLTENTDIRIVYPKQDLLKVKEKNPDILLYHKLDTHWNYAGGYIGARSLAKELGIDMPSLNELFLHKTLSSEGDLANMLNIAIEDGDIDYEISGISPLKTANEKWDFHSEFIYHTIGADPRKLFVRRDSFSTSLAPHLATQFENSLWVHGSSFDQQQIFDYDADIFILEVAERYVGGLAGHMVSFLSSSVENDDNGFKIISLTPAIDQADLQYTSVYRRSDDKDNLEAIQVLEPFNEQIDINVPSNETGEIYVHIFSDKSGKEILEEAIVGY